jgi:hypothetical protein
MTSGNAYRSLELLFDQGDVTFQPVDPRSPLLWLQMTRPPLPPPSEMVLDNLGRVDPASASEE